MAHAVRAAFRGVPRAGERAGCAAGYRTGCGPHLQKAAKLEVSKFAAPVPNPQPCFYTIQRAVGFLYICLPRLEEAVNEEIQSNDNARMSVYSPILERTDAA
jgi:hypothetical protein